MLCYVPLLYMLLFIWCRAEEVSQTILEKCVINNPVAGTLFILSAISARERETQCPPPTVAEGKNCLGIQHDHQRLQKSRTGSGFQDSVLLKLVVAVLL